MSDESELGEMAQLKFLVDLLAAKGRLPDDSATTEKLEDSVEAAVFAQDNSGSIAKDMEHVRRIALGVRDRLSVDAWRILTDMCDEFTRRPPPRLTRADAQLAVIDGILNRLSAFSGQVADGMTRDQGWLFLDIGRRLERVINLAHVLQYGLLQPDAEEPTRLLAVLEIANSAMTYQSRYVSGPDAARVLDLLLADESNPRSIGFQLATLYQHVRGLRSGGAQLAHDAPELNLVTRAFSDLRLLDVDALARYSRKGRRTRLAARLQEYIQAMEELSSVLTRTYLTHVQASRSWNGAAR
jgi:uncharacterized alpha-E superfamily protein